MTTFSKWESVTRTYLKNEFKSAPSFDDYAELVSWLSEHIFEIADEAAGMKELDIYKKLHERERKRKE